MYSRRERWMRDERAEDGSVIRGYRRVTAGKVRFGGRTFTHPMLRDLEGLYVPMTWAEFWQINAQFMRSRFEYVTLQEIHKA